MLSITNRQIEISKRWTEVHIMKMFDKLYYRPETVDLSDEYVYECSYTIVLKFIKVCDPNHNLCECVQYITPQFMMYLPGYSDDIISCITLYKRGHNIKVLESIQEHNQILICPCGRLGRNSYLAEEDHGKCYNCYIYGFKRGEICSICHEDDGKPWIKTSCGHHFHELCWHRIIPQFGIKKCPLCRTEQQERDSIERL